MTVATGGHPRRVANVQSVRARSRIVPSHRRSFQDSSRRAGLAESVDAVHSKCIVERRAGSSPASGTDEGTVDHVVDSAFLHSLGGVSTRGLEVHTHRSRSLPMIFEAAHAHHSAHAAALSPRRSRVRISVPLSRAARMSAASSPFPTPLPCACGATATSSMSTWGRKVGPRRGGRAAMSLAGHRARPVPRLRGDQLRLWASSVRVSSTSASSSVGT